MLQMDSMSFKGKKKGKGAYFINKLFYKIRNEHNLHVSPLSQHDFPHLVTKPIHTQSLMILSALSSAHELPQALRSLTFVLSKSESSLKT